MIPFWHPEVGEEERLLVERVLASGYLNEGDVTAEFERQLADLLGVPYAVATTSGTAALSLALVALGVGHGDEVVVPDVTFAATANAVLLAGARPVLADVEPNTLTLDPEAVSSVLTPFTQAVVPVHVSGRGGRISDLRRLCDGEGVALVEDAAEALLSRHDGRCLGTIGDAGCYSFSPNKLITTGQGGLVVTRDEGVYQRLRELKDQGRRVRGTGGDDHHGAVGYNFKLTNLQAAVGIAQLTRLEERIAVRWKAHRAYVDHLRGIQGIDVIPFRDEEVPLWTDVLCEQRDALDAHLAGRGVECRRYWRPLHTQPPFATADRFPIASTLAPRAMWLPSAFSLTSEDLDAVARAVEAFSERP